MAKEQKHTIVADGIEITVKITVDNVEYVSMTDIAKIRSKDTNMVLANWIRKKDTLELLAVWEAENNPDFDQQACEAIMAGAGGSEFSLSPKKWIEATGAIGIQSKAGRYGGTFASMSIAVEFMSWIKPVLRLSFIQEFQQWKSAEKPKRKTAASRAAGVKRGTARQAAQVEAVTSTVYGKAPPALQWNPDFEALSEEDIINMALFGVTQAQYDIDNPTQRAKVHEGTQLEQIITHWCMQNKNEELISAGYTKQERFGYLNWYAINSVSAIKDKRKLDEAAYWVDYEL